MREELLTAFTAERENVEQAARMASSQILSVFEGGKRLGKGGYFFSGISTRLVQKLTAGFAFIALAIRCGSAAGLMATVSTSTTLRC